MKYDKTGNAESYWNKLAVQNHATAAIDPADRLGKKNAYIAHCRNLALASGLKALLPGARVLDYGCGTGTFLSWVSNWRPVLSCFGADFSKEMLHIALKLNPALFGRIIASDGQQLPFRESCFDAICTAGTLVYLLEDQALLSLAKEFRRTLVRDGTVVSVEQIRCRTHHQPIHHKIQRAPAEIIEVFAQAGFELQEWRPIRRGRFPLIYFIRYGMIPIRWHDSIARFEARLWSNFSLPQIDYADALFIWRARK
jgi:SAM-dependent methyltransferase